MVRLSGCRCEQCCPTLPAQEFSTWVVASDGSVDGLWNTAPRRCRGLTFPRRCSADLDEITLAASGSDVVFSSLAFHYVHDLTRLFGEVAHSLVDGGRFVFSVEHPIFSAPSQQAFEELSDGRSVWPLENYLVEGSRTTSWLADGVVKQHRTIATYVNAIVEAGLTVEHVDEWGPSAEQIAARPELAEDLHRPWFLLMSAHKG